METLAEQPRCSFFFFFFRKHSENTQNILLCCLLKIFLFFGFSLFLSVTAPPPPPPPPASTPSSPASALVSPQLLFLNFTPALYSWLFIYRLCHCLLFLPLLSPATSLSSLHPSVLARVSPLAHLWFKPPAPPAIVPAVHPHVSRL